MNFTKPTVTYKNPVSTFCKRKQTYCEHANVMGNCAYTRCVKRTYEVVTASTGVNLGRWLGGDTE